jgi:hypothetical protein
LIYFKKRRSIEITDNAVLKSRRPNWLLCLISLCKIGVSSERAK